MKGFLRTVGLRLARILGAKIVDPETGRAIGRALILPWRGRVYIIGLDKPVQPIFLPQERLIFWRQSMGFSLRNPPDFSRERPRREDDQSGRDASRKAV